MMLTTKNPVPDNQEGMSRLYDQLINDCLFPTRTMRESNRLISAFRRLRRIK